MSIEAVNPYPPIIFKDRYSFKDIHKQEAVKILNLSYHNTHLEKGNAKSSIGYQTFAPHKNEFFKDFFDWANLTALEIFKLWNIKGPNDFFIGNSWINCHEKGGVTVSHNHGFSCLSLIGYITLPKNAGVTEFKDPHYEFKNLHEYKDENSGPKEFLPVEVHQGDVVFFPGWLSHRSQISYSNDQRLIISANFINFTSVSNFTIQHVYRY